MNNRTTVMLKNIEVIVTWPSAYSMILKQNILSQNPSSADWPQTVYICQSSSNYCFNKKTNLSNQTDFSWIIPRPIPTTTEITSTFRTLSKLYGNWRVWNLIIIHLLLSGDYIIYLSFSPYWLDHSQLGNHNHGLYSLRCWKSILLAPSPTILSHTVWHLIKIKDTSWLLHHPGSQQLPHGPVAPWQSLHVHIDMHQTEQSLHSNSVWVGKPHTLSHEGTNLIRGWKSIVLAPSPMTSLQYDI